VGVEPAAILAAAEEALRGENHSGRVPDLWDGKASSRILDVIEGEG
jgi:hypothetical protein